MKNKLFATVAFLISSFALAQVGVNTENPQGIFNIDGAKDNPATGTPTAAQGANDFVVMSDGKVGVGTASPSSSAILDITAANKGVLFPRVSLASGTDATTVSSPATGLLVYNTNTGLVTTLGNGTGYYYNQGTPLNPLWIKLATGSASSAKAFGNISPSIVVTLGSLDVRYSSNTRGGYIQLRSTTGASLNTEIFDIEHFNTNQSYNAGSTPTITTTFTSVGTGVDAFNEMNILYVLIASSNELYRITFNLFTTHQMMLVERF